MTSIAGSVAISGFWTMRLTAYTRAARAHSSTPSRSLPGSPDPLPEVLMRPTPAIASASPTALVAVKRSPRNTAASSATMTGALCRTSEAVPASTCCSPSLSATL